MYLEDDITRETFFPDTNGIFDTTIMRDRGSFAVSGTMKEVAAGPSTSAPSTPTPALPHPSARPRSGGHPANTFQNPLRRAKSVRKQIYMADVLDSGKLSVYSMSMYFL